MGKTSIEWAEHSVNPFRARNRDDLTKVGHFCEKVSPGCTRCYSDQLQPRFGLFPFLAENHDKVDIFLDENVLRGVVSRKKPTTYFWCSMTDMFLRHHSTKQINQCFGAMALTQWHRHIVLTKRHERMLEWAKEGRYSSQCVEVLNVGNGNVRSGSWINPLENVILSVSTENQEYMDKRAPAICEIAEMGWNTMISIEPLLGKVVVPERYLALQERGWIIVGGESTAKARPCHPDWVRAIRDQCVDARVPFHFKQYGEYSTIFDCDRDDPDRGSCWRVGQQHPEGRWLNLEGGHGFSAGERVVFVVPVGKKAAGRMLDGCTWDEKPEVLW